MRLPIYNVHIYEDGIMVDTGGLSVSLDAAKLIQAVLDADEDLVRKYTAALGEVRTYPRSPSDKLIDNPVSV
jgi:hypothetical protein